MVDGLKAGNESLKQLQKIMSFEDVEKIMDETREAVKYQNEIETLIIGVNLTEEDEEAIMAKQSFFGKGRRGRKVREGALILFKMLIWVNLWKCKIIFYFRSFALC